MELCALSLDTSFSLVMTFKLESGSCALSSLRCSDGVVSINLYEFSSKDLIFLDVTRPLKGFTKITDPFSWIEF